MVNWRRIQVKAPTIDSLVYQRVPELGEPPGQTVTGAPPAVTRVSPAWTDRVSRPGFRVAPARSEPPESPSGAPAKRPR